MSDAETWIRQKYETKNQVMDLKFTGKTNADRNRIETIRNL